MNKKDLIEELKRHNFPEEILQAFEKVDRSKFVPKEYKNLSYGDFPLYIGHGQTISQPYTIAFMLALLKVKDKQNILEIGSGSGYVLELLSQLDPHGKIIGIERVVNLVESSRENLRHLRNISVIHSDGSKGFAQKAPYDRILVSATAHEIPEKLKEQLIVGGILVAPVGSPNSCSIVVFEKGKNKNKIQEYSGFRFVPLIED